MSPRSAPVLIRAERVLMRELQLDIELTFFVVEISDIYFFRTQTLLGIKKKICPGWSC